MKITREQAYEMVRENEGRAYDYHEFSLENGWDIEDLVNYLEGLEKSTDNDYTLVISDIEHRVESCGFDALTKTLVYEALLDKDDLNYLYGYVTL